MTNKITADIIESYLNCKYKGYLKLSGESGRKSDYETMTTVARASSRNQAVAKLVVRFGEGDACRGTIITAATLKQGTPLLADADIENEDLSLRFDALKRADGASKLGDHHYVPVLHNHGDKVDRRQKLLLAVLGLALARVQGLRPADGLVARGREARLGKVRLDAKLYRQAEQVLDEVKRFKAGGDSPRMILNKHCKVCEFRQRCRKPAEQADDISLLETVGDKELRKLNRKGIFTLTQLSCTFRPRKRGKRVKRKSYNYYPALHAWPSARRRFTSMERRTCPGSRFRYSSTRRALTVVSCICWASSLSRATLRRCTLSGQTVSTRRQRRSTPSWTCWRATRISASSTTAATR